VTLIAGAFSTDDGWSPYELATQLARDTCRYQHLHSRILVRDPRCACYVIEREGAHDTVARLPAAGDRTAFVVGDTAPAGKHRQVLLNNVSGQDGTSLLDVNGCWTAILYDSDTRSLRLGSDLLGTAWLYLAQWAKGYVFCSDFGALVSNYPAPLTLDYETSLVTLGLSYSPDDRTCFKEITILPPGRVIALSDRGMQTVSRRQISYGDKYVDVPTKRKHELMDTLFARAGEDWCVPCASEVVVSLSGGYDSRYGLGVLLDNGITPRCLTFGHHRSADARLARSLCRELGLDFKLYSVGTTSFDVWRRSVEQSGSVGGFQWANGWAEEWLALLGRSGSHVLLGYLGDALSGKHLVQYESADSRWLDNWERWSLDEGWSDSPLLRPEANEALRECVRTGLSREIGQTSFAFAHQQALHLDWYGRQRRFVAAQPNLIKRFLTPVPFFYTDYMLEFWANIPFDDLRDQALYLGYAQNRFPALFKARRRARLHERAWGASTNALIAMVPGMKSYFRASEIDTESLITRHKASVVSMVKDVEPRIERIFDMQALRMEIDAFPNARRLSAVQLTRLVNLCILLRLSMKDGTRAGC
jgi:hypothetical protein